MQGLKFVGKETRRMPPNPELFRLQNIDTLALEVKAPEVIEAPSNFTSTWRVLTLGFTATGYVGDLNYDRNTSNQPTQISFASGFLILVSGKMRPNLYCLFFVWAMGSIRPKA